MVLDVFTWGFLVGSAALFFVLFGVAGLFVVAVCVLALLCCEWDLLGVDEGLVDVGDVGDVGGESLDDVLREDMEFRVLADDLWGCLDEQ